jgi:GR25 family glycosyltransferase involved in LPS biosynthesis
MGCALSHIRVWLALAAPAPSPPPFALVLEDDVELAPAFLDRLRAGLAALDAAGGWDLVCVGARQQMDEHVDFDSEWAGPGLMRIRNYRNCHTHAYALTRAGAGRLLEAAGREGVICGLDWFMAIQHSRLRAFAFMPSLAGQTPAVARHTDIARHAAAWGAASAAAQLAEAGIAG